jgi:hypothetical protein
MEIIYISPLDLLCTSEGCLARLGDQPDQLISFDYAHLTPAGSKFVVEKNF